MNIKRFLRNAAIVIACISGLTFIIFIFGTIFSLIVYGIAALFIHFGPFAVPTIFGILAGPFLAAEIIKEVDYDNSHKE